jgi:hypothetical protein
VAGVDTMSVMDVLKKNKKGLIWGFLFGTVGIFLIALLSLMTPIVEIISMPFLMPGRYFSSLITGGSDASDIQVALLYLCTGIFYAIVGMFIQEIIRAMRKPNSPVMPKKAAPKKK